MKKLFSALVLCCFFVPSAFAEFIDQGDGTVWDSSTGLMWQKDFGTHGVIPGDEGLDPAFFYWGDGDACDGTAANEDDGLCYCSSLSITTPDGTYDDWRAPSRNELHSIFNYDNTPIPYQDAFLHDAAEHFYIWTSTTNIANTAKAWAAGPMGEGSLTHGNGKFQTNHVRCVRGRVFKVSVSPGANLAVSDASEGDNWVNYQGDQTVTYTATSGSITNVVIDGVNQGPQASPYSYTFSTVAGNHTISATTAADTHDITVTVGENGKVTDVNSGSDVLTGAVIIVDTGATRTFEVTPATNYSIDQVQFNGSDVTLDGNNQYTTAPIAANGNTFSATFVENPKYTLTVATEGSGSVTSDDGQIIDCPDNNCSNDYYEGTQIVLTATAADGAVFQGWSGECTDSQPTCTVDMDQARNVTATFTAGSPSMLLLQMPAIISGQNE